MPNKTLAVSTKTIKHGIIEVQGKSRKTRKKLALRRCADIEVFKATPHRAGGADAQSDFSSDCMKMTPLG